jgi:tetratricopeptide (TPR) repeat protein
VRDRPPSREKAFVLAQLAYRAASVRDPAWEQYAAEALAMVEGLGLDDLRAQVLTVIGTARTQTGQPGGIDALEQAVDVADAIDSSASIRARLNLAAELQIRGDLQGAFDVQVDARRDAERFGVRESIRHLQSELVWWWYWRGRWDESVREADAFLAEVEAGDPHAVGEIVCPLLRAHIRLARDDLAAAISDGEQAVKAARRWSTWGNLETALAGLARVLLAAGRSDEAEALVTEVLEAGLNPYSLPDLAVVLVALDRGDKLPAPPRPSPWADAARAFTTGDYIGAADLYARIGSLSDEGDARLRSGEEDQVSRALEFYRSVGATRYIREGEALLAASAAKRSSGATGA